MKSTKKLLSLILALALTVSLAVPAMAAEQPTAQITQQSNSNELIITRDENGEIRYETSNGIEPRIPGWPNILEVKVKDLNANKVRVSIQNIGLDWVDEVTMHINLYNERGLQSSKDYKEESIKQFIPRNIDLYLVGWTRIVITNIVGKDEGDVGYLPDIDYSK